MGVGPISGAGPAATFATVVEHGATAGTARPANAVLVIWKGTVEPTNGEDGDLYVDTSA